MQNSYKVLNKTWGKTESDSNPNLRTGLINCCVDNTRCPFYNASTHPCCTKNSNFHVAQHICRPAKQKPVNSSQLLCSSDSKPQFWNTCKINYESNPTNYIIGLGNLIPNSHYGISFSDLIFSFMSDPNGNIYFTKDKKAIPFMQIPYNVIMVHNYQQGSSLSTLPTILYGKKNKQNIKFVFNTRFPTPNHNMCMQTKPSLVKIDGGALGIYDPFTQTSSKPTNIPQPNFGITSCKNRHQNTGDCSPNFDCGSL